MRVKRLFGRGEDMPEPDSAPVGWRRRWARTLVLVPLLIGLFLVSVVELGHPAAGKAGRAGLMAALEDPLALFAERSPGERGGGALLSTKPGGPTERVLSEVRDRDPAAGDAGPIPPATPEDLAALPNGLPNEDSLPGGGGGPGGGAPGPGAFSPSFAPFPQGPNDPPDPGIIPGVPPPPGGGISAVPEPATWAMLVLGFLGVGAVLRRRAGKDAHTTIVR